MPLSPPLNRFERALRLRFPGRYAVVQRPPLAVETTAVTAEAPAALTAAPESWIVQASPDLVHWEQIGTVQPGESTDEFVDLDAHNHAKRFYRFVPVPVVEP